jgi:hypothetical protein
VVIPREFRTSGIILALAKAEIRHVFDFTCLTDGKIGALPPVIIQLSDVHSQFSKWQIGCKISSKSNVFIACQVGISVSEILFWKQRK